MAIKNEILSLLEQNRGVDLSGQRIAEWLGVSRNAVWKAVRALEAEGYAIEAAPNRGYRLRSDCDRLSDEGIRARLRHRIDLRLLDQVDSTNNEAKRMLSDGFQGTALIVARSQSAGRGRMGRSFYSPEGGGIYLSLCICDPKGLQTPDSPDSSSGSGHGGISRITEAAALAVCQAIEELSDLRPSIKWVNDVYLGGRKVCGILSEAVCDVESGRVQSVIVGIGVNIITRTFPDEIAGRVGSLGVTIPPATLIARICDRLLDFWENLADPAILEGCRARSMVIGREIDFYEGDKKRSGVALGLDGEGGLIVDCDGRRTVLYSGQISVRLKGESL